MHLVHSKHGVNMCFVNGGGKAGPGYGDSMYKETEGGVC